LLDTGIKYTHSLTLIQSCWNRWGQFKPQSST